LVTAERDRSALDEERRSLPPSPTAAASRSAMAFISLRALASTVGIVKPIRLLRIFPQFVNAALVLYFGP